MAFKVKVTDIDAEEVMVEVPSNMVEITANSTVVDRLDRRRLSCSHCPLHKKENATRHPRTDRYKSHRWNFPIRGSNGQDANA
jgi:hypothetical protein